MLALPRTARVLQLRGRVDAGMSQRPDDFDLEVSPLETSSGDPTVSQSAPDPSARRRTRIQRALVLTSIVVLLGLAASLFALTRATTRADLSHLLDRLTPQPTPAPTYSPSGEDAFLWEHTVPWGQLRIDGKAGPDVRGWALQGYAFDDPHGSAFHLPLGHHALDYRAAPFPTLTCTVSVPASSADTCPLSQAPAFLARWNVKPKTRLLDLQATITRLPAEQAQAVLVVAQAQLASFKTPFPPGVVAVGDHYVDSSGQVRRATENLTVTPQLHVGTAFVQYEGRECVTLCSANNIQDAYSEENWNLLASLALTWRYTTATGQVVAVGPSVAKGVHDDLDRGTMFFLTQWHDGTWQAQPQLDTSSGSILLICPPGNPYHETLDHLLAQTPNGANFTWSTTIETAELGCLYVGSRTDPTTGQPVGPTILTFYQAGALVTVGASAQRLFPSLPVASAHERALVEVVSPDVIG
jgi:hypothetical protein